MKILIAVDMEGITGVTTWDQVTPGHAEYARFRKLMTDDVNAAIRGACNAGADEVTVADGHWNGSNILIEELDPRGKLNSGSPSPLSMMQGIDESIDGVIFIGYHARNGSPNAVLDHTWSSKTVANVWLNEMLTGEYGLNAAVAGHFGVPVVMASGDQTACAQVTELLGDVETAVVKQASGRFAAECLPPQVSQEMISLSAERAVERLTEGDAPEPFVLDMPITVTVEFFSSDMADRATRIPFTKREGTRVSLTMPEMEISIQWLPRHGDAGGRMNIQALMMMFPVVFMVHDFEELCFLESWIRKNADFLRGTLAGKNWLKLEGYSTAALGITILLMFLFVSLTSILSVIFSWYTLFAAAMIVFTLHNLFHILQPLLLRRYVPALGSAIITLPYPLYVLRTMDRLDLFMWRDTLHFFAVIWRHNIHVPGSRRTNWLLDRSAIQSFVKFAVITVPKVGENHLCPANQPSGRFTDKKVCQLQAFRVKDFAADALVRQRTRRKI